MRKVIIALMSVYCLNLTGQDLVGAWEWTEVENDREVKTSVIITDKYQVATWYDANTGAFIATNGGSWSLEGNTVSETVEFDTRDSSNVGNQISFDIEWDGNDRVRIVGMEIWMTRIDAGDPGALAGAWLISGRMRDGEIRERSTDRPRKTMKILSGTRFQWIAYNIETKQFMGSGGGTYTTVDGKYTENIEFFSRDDSRVGASLEFDFEIKEGKWHHSGKSSKGEPMYEVWSTRQK